MTLDRPWRHAGPALALAMACAALAWRDCMLLATSLVLAHRLLLLRMHRLGAQRALAAAADAWSIGALTAGAATALLIGLVAAELEWWQPTTEHVSASLLMLLLGALWCCIGRRGWIAAARELRPWLLLAAGYLTAIESRSGGFAFAPCLFSAAVAAVLLRAGWLLAAGTAPALLHGGE